MIGQILFILLVGTAVWLIARRVRRIISNIRLGRAAETAPHPDRWKHVLLIAFGQKKMFARPVAAVLHLLVYAGFILINLEVLEFFIDGISGTHRNLAPFLGKYYPLLISGFEWLAAGVTVACIFFLIRRNVLRIPRFQSPELTRWPKLDANIILITEIVLMAAIITMNACDQILQTRLPEHYTPVGTFTISNLCTGIFQGVETSILVILERVAWWFHLAGILAFALYVTWSKHLHIFLAFPHTYYARVTAPGHMSNMPLVTREVRSMLGLDTGIPPSTETPGKFGAQDVTDLPRTALLGAYACTECGRCTSECPANLTGKKLSPRKIMMDVRDRMEEIGESLAAGGPGANDGKPLLGTRITKEEINACTSCNACVEACPVLINPLDVIIELRRYVSMEESGAPASWNAMYQNMETNFAPWKFAPSDRFNWKELTRDKS